MRLPLMIFAACLLAGAASAQEKKVWTAAPMPGYLPDNVPPADRAGGTTGAGESSPFSALPTGAQDGAQPNATSSDGDSSGGDLVTPDVSK